MYIHVYISVHHSCVKYQPEMRLVYYNYECIKLLQERNKRYINFSDLVISDSNIILFLFIVSM